MTSNLGHIVRTIITSEGLNTRSISKYFEIRTSPLRIFKNFEGVSSTLLKDNPR